MESSRSTKGAKIRKYYDLPSSAMSPLPLSQSPPRDKTPRRRSPLFYPSHSPPFYRTRFPRYPSSLSLAPFYALCHFLLCRQSHSRRNLHPFLLHIHLYYIPYPLHWSIPTPPSHSRCAQVWSTLRLLSSLTHSRPNVTNATMIYLHLLSGLIVGTADVYKQPSSSRRRVVIESNPICVYLCFSYVVLPYRPICVFSLLYLLSLFSSLLSGLLDHIHATSLMHGIE